MFKESETESLACIKYEPVLNKLLLILKIFLEALTWNWYICKINQ